MAHARVAVGGSDRRMRALSQKPVTLRGARPHPRAHARASQGFPACARGQRRSGACARYLRRTRVARFPQLQAPAPHRPPLLAPSPPVPFLSSRNGAGAARGRAPGTRLALGLALSATAPLAPPRALAQSVAPKAPLSSGGGGSCFRFLVSLQSGVASSTQPPLPLLNGAAAAEGCGCGGGGGNWRPRRPPLLPPRVRGRWVPGPARLGVWGWASAGFEEAPGMRLEAVAALFLQAFPGPVAATAAAYPAAPGKVGSKPPGRSGAARGHGLRVRGACRRRCPRRRASLLRAVAEAVERRRDDGGGGGRCPSSFLSTYLPFRQQLGPCSHGLWRGGCLYVSGFRGGFSGQKSGRRPVQGSAPGEGPMPGQLKA